MGRPQADIDVEKLLQQMDDQVPQKEMSKTLGISIPTLRKKIDDLRAEQGIILETKSVENLRVIKIKTKVMDRIENQLHTMEPDTLLKALSTLNKMDKSEGGDEKVKGLLGIISALDEEADRRADEKVEEKLLEERTINVTKNNNNYPNL